MNEASAPRRATVRWLLFGLILFGIILVPFFLAGERIEAWSRQYLDAAPQHSLAVAAALALLLASDILLPVPSSLLSVACGWTLGLGWGSAVSFCGMTAGCAIGYWLGARAGRAATQRLVGAEELRRIELASARFGDWMIVVFRPVPMLAEASAFFAGIIRLPPKRFFLIAALANLGVSIVYAAVGAYSVQADSFLLAFGASIALPWIAIIATKRRAR